MIALHFFKPEEKDKAVKLSDLTLTLVEIFDKSSAEELSSESLRELYSKESITRYDFLELIRNALLEVLNKSCKLGTYCFQSRDDDEVFCKVFSEDHILLEKANISGYRLKMNPELEEVPVMKNFMPKVPFKSSLYNSDPQLYAKQGKDLLQNIDRIRLIEELIREKVNIEMLIKHKVLIDTYPLHEAGEVAELKEDLLKMSQLKISVPVHKIKNYLGEKVAYYFIWLQYYTNRLFFVGVVGLGVWGIGKVYGKNEFEDRMSFYEIAELVFASFICIWAAVFTIFWERRASKYAVEFGSKDQTEPNFYRSDFNGELVKNPITQKLERTFSKKQKVFRMVLSYLSSFFMVGLIIVLTSSLFIYRGILLQGDKNSWGPTLVAVLNTLQIYLMNFVYNIVAVKLNNWENHKTESNYENALVVKKVGFQFVNYYISLFYIAFFKEYVEGCNGADCMGELNFNLWVMFILNMVFNVVELGIPFLTEKLKFQAEEKKVVKLKQEGKTVRTEMSYAEKQGKMEKLVLPDEYLELVMNFGYIIFFAVAFPLGPIIYWAFNILEVRADSYKFLTLFKRPYPMEASNIGVWKEVMNFLALFAVVTNIGLMIFTENILHVSKEQKWVWFIIIEHLLLLVISLLLKYYPTESEFLHNVLQRQDHLKDKFYYHNLTAKKQFESLEPPFPLEKEVNFQDKDT